MGGSLARAGSEDGGIHDEPRDTARSEDIPRQGRGGEKSLRVDPETATGARIEAGGGRFRLARSPGLTNQSRRSRIDLSEHRGEGGTQGFRSKGAPHGIPPPKPGWGRLRFLGRRLGILE